MNAALVEYKIARLERELKELKAIVHRTKQKRKSEKGIISLKGFLKGKTDLSLKDIQKFKFKGKGI